MKRIAVLSGKGGVGKSSITASLAIALKDRVKLVLADTDTDCPNLHILFDGKVRESQILQASHLAKINYDKCIKCGMCANVCKFDALEFKGEPIISELFCEGCGACKVACPANAIEINPVDSGEAKIIDTDEGFPLVYGRLYPGKAGSGKIVFDVRTKADETAKTENAELILIDSAAGIGCPVIASITGCDYALGVVEPSQSSIRDLERALEVVEHFNIPYGVVMNKAGLSEEKEAMIREKWKDCILGELPYDPEVPRLLAQKKPPIMGEGRIKNSIIEISEAIGRR